MEYHFEKNELAAGIINILKKNISILLLITLLFTVIEGIISFCFLKSYYETEVTMLIENTPDNKMNLHKTRKLNADVNSINTYAKIAKSRSVLEKTSIQLGKDKSLYKELKKSISVSPKVETKILSIKCRGNSKIEALELARAGTNSFIEVSKTIFPKCNIQIIDNQNATKVSIVFKRALNIVAAFVLGLMVAIAVVSIKEYCGDLIVSEKDIEKYLYIPVIAIVPKYQVKNKVYMEVKNEFKYKI